MTRDDLIQSLIARPEQLEHWALLSDLQQQQGDPRGELLAMDLAIEAHPEQAAQLALRRTAHLDAHLQVLLGEVLSQVVKEGYGQVRWHRGYLTELAYVGDASLGHRRSVQWLVKALVAQPEPLVFLRKLSLARTDLSEASPLTRFQALKEVDLSGTLVASLDWVGQLPALELVKLRSCGLERVQVEAARAQFPKVRFAT